MKFDDLIVNYLGEFGRYQKVQFLLVCLPTLFTAFHALSWTFSGANIPHRCAFTGETKTSQFWLPTTDSRINIQKCDLTEHPEWTRCPYEACTYNNDTKCANGFVYDNSEIKFGAMQRWDIVCDRSVLKAVIQSMYYVGQMAGSLVFGFLGDRIGRKKVFFIAINVLIISGIGMVLAPHWIMFSFFRIAVGFAHPGIFVIAVVIGMELVGPSKRKIASIFTGIFFALGQMFLGIMAYYLRDYQHLQLAISAPAIVFISYWWLIPESARWLVSQKRFEDADKVIRKAARWNKTTVPEKWWEELETEGTTSTKEGPQKKHNFVDLVRTPKLRRISISIMLCWPIVSMVYYGVSMNTNFLGGNLYTTFIFGALIEIPSVLAVFVLIDKIGRRPLLSGGFTIASLCMISNLLAGSNAHWFVSMAQFLIAKGAITATYASIYTFTPELFPTVIRNTAMGMCSMMARVGAILASYISMWLVDQFGKVAMIVPFASLGLVAAAIVLTLPETAGKELPETIEQLEGHIKAHELQPLNANKTE
ncbi:unnamed protein product [Bursaphelenchus okinawaensis]|uniref:Major facilitator superfamily (MFS) profile domain-containing protein n=1 Tax=Bursaphelenchus okinawaensis TaxID=465554 RepID=A0A811KTU8_9BILA|nr:unnamed protein product [Bursaphelenchus okinawaensis]CAG9111565.1 unnamed protein product [Bursaphelenchus okinawaensis]